MKKMMIVFMLVMVSLNAAAHSPKGANLDYLDNKLAIKIHHPVSFPSYHYVERITIDINERKVFETEFKEQSSETGVLYVVDGINAYEGDRIKLTAKCNFYGKIEESIQVGEDDRPFPESEQLFRMNRTQIMDNFPGNGTAEGSANRLWIYVALAVAVLTGVIVILWDRILEGYGIFKDKLKGSENGSEDEYEDGGEGSGSRYGETILEEDGSDEEDADEDEDSSGRDYFDEEDGSSEDGSEEDEDVWHTREYLD